jgi:carbamoyl-phosphate synthase small subunit
VDTRALTIKIRDKGTMKGALATEEIDDDELLEMAVKQPDITEIDLVDMVCVREPVILNEDASGRVVIVDCGIKRNSIDALLERDLGVVIVPYTTSPAEIMDYEPDGLLISSGPGDPTRVRDAIDTVKALSERLPIFGICLGQQIIALAFGARIYKMKFGHRGVNQPVKDLRSGTVSITSQNHGFTVDPDSVKGTDIEITQLNLNDGTPEGIEHRELPVFSVQYHPEAGPGPHDTVNIFDRFVDVLREY